MTHILWLGDLQIAQQAMVFLSGLKPTRGFEEPLGTGHSVVDVCPEAFPKVGSEDDMDTKMY